MLAEPLPPNDSKSISLALANTFQGFHQLIKVGPARCEFGEVPFVLGLRVSRLRPPTERFGQHVSRFPFLATRVIRPLDEGERDRSLPIQKPSTRASEDDGIGCGCCGASGLNPRLSSAPTLGLRIAQPASEPRRHLPNPSQRLWKPMRRRPKPRTERLQQYVGGRDDQGNEIKIRGQTHGPFTIIRRVPYRYQELRSPREPRRVCRSSLSGPRRAPNWPAQ